MSERLKEWLDKYEPELKQYDPEARVIPSWALSAGEWCELIRRARLGAAVEAMPRMLTVPDREYPDNSVDFVGLGIDDMGNWQVCRWYEGEPSDDGTVGDGKTPAQALADAYETLKLKA